MGARPYSMTCPHCTKTLKYAPGAIGKVARCPGCGKPVTVPSPQDGSKIDAPLDVQPPHNSAAPSHVASSCPPREQTSPDEPPTLPIESDSTDVDTVPPPCPIEANEEIGRPVFPSTSRRAIPVQPTRPLIPIVVGTTLCGVVVFVLLAVGLVYAINNVVNRPLQKVITTDARNAGIAAKVHYGNLARSILVFDLKKVSATNSRADVFRVFLQYADAVKDKQFDEVQLAWRGKVKFVIDGTYFQKLGREFDFQNPVYTIRTFPENLRTPTGARAFSVWEGGMLGVLKAQMDDFNCFHDQWYLDDLKHSL